MVKAATAKRHINTRPGMLGAEVGRRIREARQARGMTLAELGGEDISRSFLSLVESGRSRISLRALAIVADRLELPIGHFVDDTPDGGTAAAELALDYAEAALARQKPDECLRMLDEVSIPFTMRTRQSLLRGRALLDVGQQREAVTVLEEAFKQSSQEDDSHLTMEIGYALGLALYTAGSHDEALTYLRTTLDELVRGPENPVLMGKIIVCIGHILYVRGDTDGALEYYTRARELFGALGDLDTLGCVYSALSMAYKQKGDLKSALRYSKLSLGAFEAKQDVRRAATELNNLAVRHQELDQLDRAMECAQQAVRRAEQIKAREVEALAHSTLAEIHVKLAEYDAAALEAQAADRLAADDTDVARIYAWIVLAKVAERQGAHAEVDDLYRRALSALEGLGYQSLLMDTALEYSLVLRKRGETERALEFALKGLQAKLAHTA